MMATKRPSTSKTSFDVLLTANAEWFEWIESAARFESLLKDKIPWERLDGSAKTFVQKRFKSTAPARQIFLNSFYLTMVSGFEEYLRMTISEVTRKVAFKKPRYADLSDAIRKMHVRESARLLKQLDSPPDYFSFSIDDLCRGLGSCVPESDAVLLSPEAFSEVKGLIKLDSFIERLGVLGISISWDKLCVEKNLKLALKLQNEKPRQVSKALKDELEKMARYRNRIAHTGGTAADVTTEIVIGHRVLLQALASAIEETI
jgi:hypothetical protein